jgi:hypothetical protein
MSRKKILINIGNSILLLILLTVTVYGINSVIEGYRVTLGSPAVTITANNICKTVKNNGTLGDIFVPTNSANEWDLFINNKPSYVDVVSCAVPSAPQSFAVSMGNQQNNLSWMAPSSNGGSIITSYNIYRSITTNSGYVQINSTSNLTYTDAGLTNGTIYYYKVSAVNVIGIGAQSTEINVRPSGYCDNDGDGRYAVSWGPICTGAQQTSIGTDCNDTCTTCFPGSTSYTTSPDGLDQDCNAVIDNTTAGTTNVRQLVSPTYEVGGSQSCTQLCANYAQSCTNIGNDAGGTNGAYWSGCPGGGTSCWSPAGSCGSALGGQWGYCACNGFHAPWTNCKCQTLLYH